ncbi:MAG: type transport system permease protein [Chloroflexota bacterium]|jgi:ABC-2 type transport system permease protein|nr:type transport system permease protein [Chloroflexota bacterium]
MNGDAASNGTDHLAGVRGSSAPWLLILRKELRELWLGGRLLPLLVLFTILMSITSVLRELESQLSLIPPSEMVFLTLLSSISFGMLMGLVIGADTVSGERERATLEPLLLSPAGRRQIVFAKFLAAVSAWPVALLLSLPYVLVLAKGDDIVLVAVLWTLLLGSLLAVAFTGFAMLISIWSRSNRTSLFVSLFVYLLFLIPTQFPGEAQKGALGYALQQVNPMQAASEFLEKLVVNNRAPQERFTYLLAEFLSAAVIVGILFVYAAPRLRLEGESPRLMRPGRRSAQAAVLVLVSGLSLGALLVPHSVALAADAGSTSTGQTSPPAIGEAPSLEIAIDKDVAALKTGDEIEFTTEVLNTGSAVSPELVVAMNIINLGKSDPVDPEDWSPERTQKIDPLDAGERAEQSWTVEAILDGNYMVYMTVIADPGTATATSLPVSSPGIHLTVAPYQSTNPGGVLPVALGIPLALTVVTILLRRYWRRERTSGSVEPDPVS